MKEMDYTLAKKLKEAEFPQYGNNRDIDGGLITISPQFGDTYDIDCYIPTLSELIEACGVAFSELNKMTHTRKPETWVAISFPCEECEIKEMRDGFGSTPEEAVANLWLALNKK